MSAHLYIEGAESKEGRVRCREGFRKLLEAMGFAGPKRMPRLSACGGRNSAFDDFKTSHAIGKPRQYVALLVDSEDPMVDVEKTWEHLKHRDGWAKPAKAMDDQVLMMTTCMETWIAADRVTLREHYGKNLQQNALPPLNDLENRHRREVQDQLIHATRKCSNAYAKGNRSFELVAKLRPEALRRKLPSFARLERILKEKL